MRVSVLPMLLCTLLASCGREVAVSDPEVRGGGEYISALAALVRNSSRVVVTEHSSEFDLFDIETGKSGLKEPLVYATRVFSEPERKFFYSTIEGLDPKTQDAFPACVPEVHHTFYFYSGTNLIETIPVCFSCGQVLWSNAGATPPWSLYAGLAKVVESVGLSPERNWDDVARDAQKNARSNTSLERTRGR